MKIMLKSLLRRFQKSPFEFGKIYCLESYLPAAIAAQSFCLKIETNKSSGLVVQTQGRVKPVEICIRDRSTAAYASSVTDGLPFSIFHKVARLIPALSATSVALNFLRNRANLICSPI